MERCAVIFLVLASLMAASQCVDRHFEVTTQSPSIKEGSCIELNLTSTSKLPILPTNWFWMKDAHRSAPRDNFNGSVILSSDAKARPVHPDFVGRAKSQDSLWPAGTKLMVLMCNATKSDSGKYSFVYELTEGERSLWAEASAVVTVEDNPCPVRISPQETLEEHQTISVMCMTSKTCHSEPQLLDHNLLTPPNGVHHIQHVAWARVEVDWQNDSQTFMCQTQGNTDKYLRAYITLDIKYSPKNVHLNLPEGVTYFQEGDNMTLICTAKGNPRPSLEWFRNGTKLPVKGATLTVQSVSSQHDGRYKCVATNRLGTESHVIAVNIKYPSTVEVRSSRTKFKQGEAMTLLCQVNKRGNPRPDSFTWHKDDRPVASRQNLTVASVQPEDMGRYTCAAFNAGFKDMKATSAELLIDVEYRPRETSLSIMGSSSAMVKAGASVLLRCAADANPKPDEYDWSLLSQDGRSWDKLSNGSEEQFLVGQVWPSDRRCYSCRAINQVGVGEDSPPLCIQVMHRPTNLLLSMPDKVTEGDQVSVRCSVESFPLSDMILTKTSVDQSSMRSLTNQLDERTQYNLLTFGFVATREDAGVYTCTAANSEGSESAQKTLEVTYAPRYALVKADPSPEVAKSTSLTLRCVADSNPPIHSVTWWKADQNVNRGQTLTLSSVALADAGVYACTAANELGLARSAPVEVKVHNGPSEPVLCMTTKVTEGERVNMLCSVESDPLSTLTLTRQSTVWAPVWPGASSRGNAVQNNMLSHTFKATSADGGVYTCEADNGLGRRSTQKTLKVTYAPKNVKVRAEPSLSVMENEMVTLQCDADSDPPVESVIWWKVNGTGSHNLSRGHNLTIASVTPAETGFYACTATNEVGSERSPSVEIDISS
ncbi:sialoadhesin-like [Hippocampus zosterae]|uniref:sialoadhesin-like n=1 Tax=Hippocampus zosterae TaxID=109293 RepID=UPI00223D818B|nr:sialoadhesin-like [Hippocampus zosterae]